MTYKLPIKVVKLLAITAFILVVLPDNPVAQTKGLKPFITQLSDTTSDYQRVFEGPPQTASMHSGLVVLAPSKSVGKHSTKDYEEAVVVLSGTGEFRITGGSTFTLSSNSVVYCPPNTEHDVVNTGTQTLRYLYIASRHK